MADMGGKSYNETAPLGAKVDLTDERELEAVRAAKQDGTIGEAYGSGSVRERVAEAGERVAQGVATASTAVREKASGLYDEAAALVRGRSAEVVGETKLSFAQLVEHRPLQLVAGAALIGFLFGRFG